MSREPIGVVGAITPYNFPFFLNIGKVIPALAVGCTVVLKPSPYTPLEAMRLGEVTYLAPEEARLHAEYIDEVVFRPWNLWKREVEA